MMDWMDQPPNALVSRDSKATLRQYQANLQRTPKPWLDLYWLDKFKENLGRCQISLQGTVAGVSAPREQ